METYFHLFKYSLVSGLQGQWELLIQRFPSRFQGCSVWCSPLSSAEHRDFCPQKSRNPAHKREWFREFTMDSKASYWSGARSSSCELLLSCLECSPPPPPPPCSTSLPKSFKAMRTCTCLLEDKLPNLESSLWWKSGLWCRSPQQGAPALKLQELSLFSIRVYPVETGGFTRSGQLHGEDPHP